MKLNILGLLVAGLILAACGSDCNNAGYASNQSSTNYSQQQTCTPTNQYQTYQGQGYTGQTNYGQTGYGQAQYPAYTGAH